MAQDMKKLMSQRSLVLGSIKRTTTFAENPPSGITAELIGTRLSRLESAWNEFSQYTQDLYTFKDDKDFVDPEEEFYECEDMYLNTQSVLKTLLAKVSSPQLPLQQESGNVTQLTEQLKKLESPTISHNIDKDLPKIKVEPFSGVYRNWPSFEKLFVSAIDTKPHWINTQKFYYLTTLLKGDAANLIKHVQMSDLAYATAWNILKTQFNRPEYIVNSYIEAFMTLPTLKNENAHELRKILDLSKEVVTGLDAIGQTGRDHWLIYILVSKLDSQSRRKWAERSRDDSSIPTISTFWTFLGQSCEELTRRGQHYNKNVFNRPNSSPMDTRPMKPRGYCNDCGSAQHMIFKCPHFLSLSVEQRHLLVNAKSLCSNCLNRGHSVDNCRSLNQGREKVQSEKNKKQNYYPKKHKPYNAASSAFPREYTPVTASNNSTLTVENLNALDNHSLLSNAITSRYVTERLLQKKPSATPTSFAQKQKAQPGENAAGVASNNFDDDIDRLSTHSLLTPAIPTKNAAERRASNNTIFNEQNSNNLSTHYLLATAIQGENAAETASNHSILSEENVNDLPTHSLLGNPANGPGQLKAATSSEQIAHSSDYYAAIPF